MAPDSLFDNVYLIQRSNGFFSQVNPDYNKPDLPLLYIRDNFPLKYKHFSLYYNDSINQSLYKEIYDLYSKNLNNLLQ